MLRKGGAVEFLEWNLFFRSEDGNGDKLSSLRKWTDIYLEALSRGRGDAKKSRQLPPDLETILNATGFVEVTSSSIDVPVGSWPLGKFTP